MTRAGVLVVLALCAMLGGLGCSSTTPRAYVAGPLAAPLRIAVLPLANYTEDPDATSHVVPILGSELLGLDGVVVADPGAVEDAMAQNPWLATDRVPLDILEKFGEALDTQAILVGSILAFGYREDGVDRVPEFSITLRLLETPGGRCLWSAVHSRYGTDRETLFGFGRVDNLERLVTLVTQEVVETFPRRVGSAGGRLDVDGSDDTDGLDGSNTKEVAP